MKPIEAGCKAIIIAAVDAQMRTADNGLRDNFASSALNVIGII